MVIIFMFFVIAGISQNCERKINSGTCQIDMFTRKVKMDVGYVKLLPS